MQRTKNSGRRDDTAKMQNWPGLTAFARTIASPITGDTLFVYDSGTSTGATPVILIHGLGDEADSWRHIFPPIARNRRVIALDLPGFGRSGIRRRATMKLHAKAVSALLRETGPAILVGSSMGGAIAELAAFQEHGMVKALVFIDGGLPSAGGSSRALLASLVPGIGERGYRAWRLDHEGAYGSLAPYYGDLTALPESDRAFLRERVIARVESESQLRAYFSSFRSFMAQAVFHAKTFRDRLAKLDIPLLVIWGELDRILPLPSREPLLAIRVNATSVTISGAGHLPHQEKPAEVAAVIDSFIAAQKL
jgi:pimeloyl-ACP methyl ester carboxylesterase